MLNTQPAETRPARSATYLLLQHSTTTNHVSEPRFSFIDREPSTCPLARSSTAPRLPLAIPKDIVQSPQQLRPAQSELTRTQDNVRYLPVLPPGQDPPILDAGRTTTPNSTADTDHHQGSSAINGLEEAKLSQDAPGIIVRAGGSAAISSSAASWLVSFASATACMDIESATSTPRDSGYQRATLLLVFSFTNLNDKEPSSLLALLLCQ